MRCKRLCILTILTVIGILYICTCTVRMYFTVHVLMALFLPALHCLFPRCRQGVSSSSSPTFYIATYSNKNSQNHQNLKLGTYQQEVVDLARPFFKVPFIIQFICISKYYTCWPIDPSSFFCILHFEILWFVPERPFLDKVDFQGEMLVIELKWIYSERFSNIRVKKFDVFPLIIAL